MAFTGPAYRITFDGSFNGNENLSAIPQGSFVEGSRNVNTHNGGAEKRGGTQIHRAQISASLICLGAGQMVTRAGTIYDYSAWSDGKVYRNGVEILTGRDTQAKVHFTAIDDLMFICNGVDVVKVDTGASVATITTAASDWTGSNQPTQIIIHSRGASRRAFALGVATKKDILYYSVGNNFQDFASAGSGTVPIHSISTEGGITTAVSKDEVLWVFGREDSFILEDSDVDPANWGYYKASFKGGVYSPRHVIVAKNSIFGINDNVEIYEIQTAQELRDYKQADIAVPFFVHSYIKQYVDKDYIADFHMAYDPKIDALKIFVVKDGDTTIKEALVFYIMQAKWAPPHDSAENSSDSGYSAAASYIGKLSTGEKRLFTCDYNGVTWELEDDTKDDNGNAYTGAVVTPWLNFDLEEDFKRYAYGRLNFISRGDYDLSLNWSVDNTDQPETTVTLETNGAALGTFILGTSVLSRAGISDQVFELGQLGRIIQFELSNDQAGEDFLLSNAVIYFQDRSKNRGQTA
jgi:hypothetical protein